MSDMAVDQLARALEATEQVIVGIRDDQWENSTPCPEWNVRDLVSHVVLGNRGFAGILNEQPPRPPAGGPDPLASRVDGDLREAYRDSAQQLLAAFRRPGALEQTITLPIGPAPGIAALHLRITEILTHGWDLARATGQPARFPDDLAAVALAFTREKLEELPPGRAPFAPRQPVPDDAPAIDRLAACLGRSVVAAEDR